MPTGTVKQSFEWTQGESNGQVAKYAGELQKPAKAAATGEGGKPTFTKGQSPLAGGDPKVAEFGKSLVEGDPAGILKGIMDATGSPFVQGTDYYWATKIQEMAKDFLARYTKSHLEPMRAAMLGAQRKLDQLGELAEEMSAKLDTHKPNEILNAKAKMGEGMMEQIDNALARAKTPEDRQRLQAEKDDLAKWLKDRDSRVGEERKELADLDRHIGALQHEAFVQRTSLPKVGDTIQDFNTSLPNGLAHTTPQALAFASSLRTFLLNSRAALNRGIAG